MDSRKKQALVAQAGGAQNRGRFHSLQKSKNRKQLIQQNEFLQRRFPSITPAMIEDQKKRRITRPKLGSSLGIKKNRLAEKVNFRSMSKPHMEEDNVSGPLTNRNRS